ncbi:MAG: magnesium transporter [Planctomycetota bacterium]|nr:magnesium transporter [Planctomycetota bacterium]
MQTDNTPKLQDLRAALERDGAELARLLAEWHPADLAEHLQDLDEGEVEEVFTRLGGEARAEVLQYADDPLRQLAAAHLSAASLAEVIRELPADEVVDLLALVDGAVAEEALHRIDLQRSTSLRELLHYDPESAGGVMTTEFVTVPVDTRVGDAIKQLKVDADRADEDVGVYVVDDEQRPVGYVTDRDLLTHRIHAPLGEVMAEAFTIRAEADQEETAQIIHKYGLEALAVVNGAGVLVGVISSVDAAEVFEEEASEDIMRLVGTAPVHQTRLPVLTRVRHRIPLQAVTVAGGLVTARLLDYALPAEPGSSVALLRYLPIIIGLAGNVGIQSSTILVRAFATGEVEEDRERAVFVSEVMTGLVIGVLCGLLTIPAAAWMEGSAAVPAWQFGTSIGVAIMVAVTWASLLGCTVPLGCKHLGIDPAVVAGPFLICLSDVSGAAIFIVVARILGQALAAGAGVP